MLPGKQTGYRRLFYAMRYSYQGFVATFKEEAAFRQELFALLVASPLAFWVAGSALEVVLLLGVILMVMVVELLNSAIESVVDRFGAEQHELAGRAKDQGSAAVMLTLFIAVLIWLVILFD